MGVPGEDSPAGVADSGAVNVIYSSLNGLTTNTPGVPAPQFWSQNSTGVPGSSEAGDGFGSSLAAGDFNGDGYSDLAIGVPYEDITAPGFLGIQTSYKDLGGIVILYGSRNGLTATDTAVPAPKYFDLSNISSKVELHDGAQLGFSLSWGDFNGDGIGDLAMGIPNYSFFSSERDFFFLSEAGAVWTIYGSHTGLNLVNNRVFVLDDFNGGGPSSSGDHFGKALTAGDFNGDGYDELAIGEPDTRQLRLSGDLTSVGEVSIISGSPTGLSIDAGSDRLGQGYSNNEHVFEGTGETGDRFGASLAAGDFNGDGIMDLAVGVPGESIGSIQGAGAIQVIYGTSTGFSRDTDRIWHQDSLGFGAETGDHFGSALAAGDFNADGRADLAIGVPFEDVLFDSGGGVFVNAADAGEVDVIYGSSTGLSIGGHSPQAWHQASPNISGTPETGDRFGSSLTAWNFGRNDPFPGGTILRATADLAIGVPYEDIGGISNAGAVNVIYGSATSNGLTANSNQFFSQDTLNVPGSPETGDHFGASVY